MGKVTSKSVDRQGRLSLGKEFASRLVIVKRIGDGVLQITRAEAIPEPEAWLYKNPNALRMVMEGIEEARAGNLTEGPDLVAGAELADAIGE